MIQRDCKLCLRRDYGEKESDYICWGCLVVIERAEKLGVISPTEIQIVEKKVYVSRAIKKVTAIK